MLDSIQYEFRFIFTTQAGAETSTFRLRLQPKVPAPCGSGSTTLIENVVFSFVLSSLPRFSPFSLPLLNPHDIFKENLVQWHLLCLRNNMVLCCRTCTMEP